MDFLGVGPVELLYILLIALIVLGPKDMVKAGRTLGRWLRKMVTSPSWQTIQKTSRDLRYLPNRLMREAGLEEQMEELNKIQKELPRGQDLGLDSVNRELQQVGKELRQSTPDLSSWTTPPISAEPPPAEAAAADEPAAATPEPLPEPDLDPEPRPQEPS